MQTVWFTDCVVVTRGSGAAGADVTDALFVEVFGLGSLSRVGKQEMCY